MNKFTTHTGLVAPLNKPNMDTDQIIPKQFLKSIGRTGFRESVFYDWRFLPDGVPNPEFVLNKPRYASASILLTGRNFGCGSSREHAAWALAEYGFRVIAAPSFADIFYNNAVKTGLLPITLTEHDIDTLVGKCERAKGYKLSISLEKSTIRDDSGFSEKFGIEKFSRFCLLNGLDDIVLTLQSESMIDAYETNTSTERFS